MRDDLRFAALVLALLAIVGMALAYSMRPARQQEPPAPSSDAAENTTWLPLSYIRRPELLSSIVIRMPFDSRYERDPQLHDRDVCVLEKRIAIGDVRADAYYYYGTVPGSPSPAGTFWGKPPSVGHSVECAPPAADFEAATRSADPEVRLLAVWGADRTATVRHLDRIVTLAALDPSPAVRDEALLTLGWSQDPRALEFLAKHLELHRNDDSSLDRRALLLAGDAGCGILVDGWMNPASGESNEMRRAIGVALHDADACRTRLFERLCPADPESYGDLVRLSNDDVFTRDIDSAESKCREYVPGMSTPGDGRIRPRAQVQYLTTDPHFDGTSSP